MQVSVLLSRGKLGGVRWTGKWAVPGRSGVWSLGRRVPLGVEERDQGRDLRWLEMEVWHLRRASRYRGDRGRIGQERREVLGRKAPGGQLRPDPEAGRAEIAVQVAGDATLGHKEPPPALGLGKGRRRGGVRSDRPEGQQRRAVIPKAAVDRDRPVA